MGFRAFVPGLGSVIVMSRESKDMQKVDTRSRSNNANNDGDRDGGNDGGIHDHHDHDGEIDIEGTTRQECC